MKNILILPLIAIFLLLAHSHLSSSAITSGCGKLGKSCNPGYIVCCKNCKFLFKEFLLNIV